MTDVWRSLKQFAQSTDASWTTAPTDNSLTNRQVRRSLSLASTTIAKSAAAAERTKHTVSDRQKHSDRNHWTSFTATTPIECCCCCCCCCVDQCGLGTYGQRGTSSGGHIASRRWNKRWPLESSYVYFHISWQTSSSSIRCRQCMSSEANWNLKTML